MSPEVLPAKSLGTPIPIISFQQFSLGYPTALATRLILENVNLEIPAGGLLLLVGPSGSGKSSLLSALLGLDDPYAPRLSTRGDVRILGERVTHPLPATLRGRASAVFQDGALLDELSPRANIALAVRGLGNAAKPQGLQLSQQVQALLEQVGLPHPPSRVAALSGGQRKRLALARALAGQPQLLVLDEPTAGLDPKSALEIAQLLKQILHQDSDPTRTIIVITHDFETFAQKADGLLSIDPRQGALNYVRATEVAAALQQLHSIENIPPGPPAVVRQGFLQIAGRFSNSYLLVLAQLPLLLFSFMRHLVPYHLSMLIRSCFELCLNPALFLALAGGIAGALATNFALDNNPLEGAFRREILIGTGKVLISAALPLLVGVLFSARAAAGACARLGGLRKHRVFEALPMIGVSPLAFLLTPLVYSCAIASALHAAIGTCSGLLASLWVAQWKLGLSPFATATALFHAVESSDYSWALTKAICSGIATAFIAYLFAARPKQSEADVAEATTGALVAATMSTLFIHGGLALMQY